MPVYNPVLDQILDLSDPSVSGRLALVGSRVVKATGTPRGRLIRNANGATRIRICKPAAPGNNRAYDDVDLINAVVREAIGIPDAIPSSGTFPLAPIVPQTVGPLVAQKRYLIVNFVALDNFTNVGASSNATGVIFTATGTTPTNWTHGSALQELTTDLSVTATYAEMAAALNATAAIIARGGVTVTNPTPGTYEVTFGAFGAQTAIAGPIAGGMVPQSVVSVSRVQPGIAATPGPGVHEVQLIRLLAVPYCFATIATALPAADYTVTQVQAPTGDLPEIQRLTLDPIPYDGTLMLTLGSAKPVIVPFDCSQDQLAALAGPTYIITKRAENSWDFAGVEPSQAVSIFVDVHGLLVPKGVTGYIALNTVGIHRLFANTTATLVRLFHSIEVQFPGQDPQPVLLEEIEFHRSLIDLGSIVPATIAGLQFVASNLAGTPWLYTTIITALTGGVAPYCLDAVDLTLLVVGTRYDFVVTGGIPQSWFVRTGDSNPADPTGQVHWIGYNSGNAATNKHWEKGE